jgi:hypothetical protein
MVNTYDILSTITPQLSRLASVMHKKAHTRRMVRLLVMNYDDNVRLEFAQVYIYYQTFVLNEVLKDKYRNDYFDKLSKWILFPSF